MNTLERPDFLRRAMEIAVASAGHSFPSLTALHNRSARSHRVTATTTHHSIALLDITLDIDGELRLIEANGSNAALSSLTADGDDGRSAHMAAAFEARNQGNVRGVALLGHQPGFLHIPEFFMRAGLFAEKLNVRQDVRLRDANESLGDERLTVVAGPLDVIASQCEESDGRLLYRKQPVLFAANTNLLPELARQGRIGYQRGQAKVDLGFFHEGKLASLIHDKSGQQRTADGTGIKPLASADCFSREACLACVRKFHESGQIAVLKINGGSGGAGIEFAHLGNTQADMFQCWDSLVTSATRKYGGSIERTMFPVRVVEFAQSTPYRVGAGDHLWDLRVQCLVWPGFVEVSPVVLRLCPEPFEKSVFSRDSVVSNLTGRKAGTQFMRSPWQVADDGRSTVLDACGLGGNIYDALINACAKWCEKAMIGAIK